MPHRATEVTSVRRHTDVGWHTKSTDQQQSLFSHPVRWLAAVTARAAFGSECIDERSSGAGTHEQVVCERQR